MKDNNAELIADLRHHSWEHTGEPTAALLWRAADALESATPRIVRTEWSESLPNDGRFEYTRSSDCDGSNEKSWRRTPSASIAVGTWELVDAIPQEARYTDGTPVLFTPTESGEQTA